MSKKEDLLQKAFHALVLRTAEMFDKGTLSDFTILKIAEGTQNFTTEKRTTFYQQLLEVLETAKTEDEILSRGIAIRDGLLM